VVAELRSAGASAQAVRFTAGEDTPANLLALLRSGSRITDLYYFGTPPILKTARFNYADFRKFADVYVGGIALLFDILTGGANSSMLRGLWLPSSVMVDTHPDDMTAYVMAKQAMECLARKSASRRPGYPGCKPIRRLHCSIDAEPPALVLGGLLRSFAKQGVAS
jgi:hypothetical protein